MNETTYADAGVNLKLGNDASKVLYEASRLTWENRDGKLGEVIEPSENFSGIRYIDISNLPEGTVTNMGFDGVGTKIELAERTMEHSTVAYDLFAMVCDDAVVRGAEPVLIGSILDVNSLEGNIDYVKQLAEGYIGAAREAGVAIVNGEIAELGSRVNGVGDFNYNWSAGIIWFANKKRLLTGMEIKKEDYLVGLREEGFRSNGLSLVRKIMEDKYGKNWHFSKRNGEYNLERIMAKELLTPSKIYAKAIVDMFGGWNLEREAKAEVHGVAHITGGGIPEKLGRMLKPSELSAMIDNPFEPSDSMKYIQEIGNVSDKEAYKTLNMGQGMIIATPSPEEVISVANQHNIEAKKIGMVLKLDKRAIFLSSKGIQDCKDILFHLD